VAGRKADSGLPQEHRDGYHPTAALDEQIVPESCINNLEWMDEKIIPNIWKSYSGSGNNPSG
jgi:hypothetical protein